jgi:hypothetical protein
MMKKIIFNSFSGIILLLGCISVHAQKEIYEIRVFKLKSSAQLDITDNFLQNAYLPALHRLGLKNIGVFKPIANDTAEFKKIVVIVPYISLDVWRRTKSNIEIDSIYKAIGKPFLDADTDHLPFVRVESTLLEAFPDQPKLIPTTLKNHTDAIYELRSYESPTKVLHTIKVDMFNAGGEVKLFKRLDFQAVFYGDVLSGSHMPNLMYMVVFANAVAHEEKWKSFGSSDKWKTISTDPAYRNDISVNHIDSWLMHRTTYSDL